MIKKIIEKKEKIDIKPLIRVRNLLDNIIREADNEYDIWVLCKLLK